jgi:hypothetical protein
MTTCCPNCSNASALGSEAASLCTECGAATVAGASIDLPLLFAGVFAAGLALLACRALRRRFAAAPAMARPALA